MDFKEISDTFREVSDTDMDTHYLLMIESSSLQYTLESELANETAVWSELKLVADAIEARRSKELSQKSVNEGLRLAKFDDDVLTARKSAIKQKFVLDALQAQVNFLERVYFTCKETLIRGHKINGR